MIAPSSAEVALRREARAADRWLILVLTLVLVSVGMLLANPVLGVVPVIGSIAGFVHQQRKAQRYLHAASLCTESASCTLDVEGELRVADGQQVRTVSLGPRQHRELRQQRLPVARIR